MQDIKIGDIVINLNDIKSITESYLGELIIKVPRYEVIENNNDKNYLYYHVRDLETDEGYYILKEYIVKINEWKDGIK